MERNSTGLQRVDDALRTSKEPDQVDEQYHERYDENVARARAILLTR
jgi:hypothetical protein